MKKATHQTDRQALTSLQQIVNIGPSIAEDLLRIGISRPQQLIGRDPFQLFQQLCDVDGTVHDPCVIDCMMAAVDYMSGNPPRSWWKYTAKRKQMVGSQRTRQPR